MARLSAHGFELYRLMKQYEPRQDEADRVLWRKRCMSIRSDRWIMQKDQIKWTDGQVHDWGWKRRGKIIEGSSPEILRDLYLKHGYSLL